MNISILFGLDETQSGKPLPHKNGKSKGHGKQKKTVLVIEDSEADVMLLRAAFEDVASHCSLEWAPTAEAGMAYFNGGKSRPDLILLDIQLARTDGFSFLTWLRAQGEGIRRLPVVMLTTSQNGDEVRRSYDLGANSYLVKPTGYEELRGLISRVVDYWLDENRQA